MKHSRKVFALIMTVAMVFTMAFATVGVSAASTSGKVGAVKWNSKNKTVSFDVTVNKKMLKGAAVSHFIINDKSSKGKTGQAGNGLFTTKANALDLYKALIKAGATPWTDKYADDALSFGYPGTNHPEVLSVKDYVALGDAYVGNPSYSKLKMIFKKGKKTYAPEKIVNYKKAGETAKAPIEMIFSGNYANQDNFNSGCVACIFSCYVGVTSNQAVGINTTTKEDNYFYASKLLKAGDKYTVTYKIQPNDTGYNYISPGEYRANMAKYVLLDVRPNDKFQASHIKGSYKATFDEAKADDATGVANIKAAVNQYGKDAKYVLCCNTGRGFAKAAADNLVKEGVKASNVKILCGGFNFWNTKYAETVAIPAK